MILETLKDSEDNYATNERELLAIVWGLARLRHCLYGVKDINIFTDHQPITFSVSESTQQQLNALKEEEAESCAATDKKSLLASTSFPNLPSYSPLVREPLRS